MTYFSSSEFEFGHQLMLELGIEFENFDAPNSEMANCEFADGQFDATKSQLEASNSEVTTVMRRTDEKSSSEFEFGRTKSQPN